MGISIGAVSIGLLSTGLVTLGLLAFGASTIAYKAYGAFSALGWDSAFSNGFSIASEAAIGTFVYAKEVNNELAAQISAMGQFKLLHHWFLLSIIVFVLVPAIWHARKVRQRMT